VAGEGSALLDPHGDLAELALAEAPRECEMAGLPRIGPPGGKINALQAKK
jgi:hypothetical protein